MIYFSALHIYNRQKQKPPFLQNVFVDKITFLNSQNQKPLFFSDEKNCNVFSNKKNMGFELKKAIPPQKCLERREGSLVSVCLTFKTKIYPYFPVKVDVNFDLKNRLLRNFSVVLFQLHNILVVFLNFGNNFVKFGLHIE